MSKIKNSDFVHLHNHTHHSLLDGLQKVPEMVDLAVEMGMEAIAVTDHGSLSGAIEFYTYAKKQGIKPIIGMEAYMAARKLTDKDPAKDKHRYHLTILAKDNDGYLNLMKLSSIAYLKGFYHKPRIDRPTLEKHRKGLIILSGCINGELGDALRNNQMDKAREIAGWYRKVFGDDYYLEVQDIGHNWPEQDQVNKRILKLSKELNIPAVVTADSHYLKPEDKQAHEALLCVQTGSVLSDENRMSLKDNDLHLKAPKEIISRWKNHPELIENTKKIADKCSVEIKLGDFLLPHFDIPEDTNEKDYLSKLVYQGLGWRYGKYSRKELAKLKPEEATKGIDKKIMDRAKNELEVIVKLGFASYFLIVQDFINWGKDRGIVFGPGRGSAAGSIISYALNITDIDPLEYDLLFERFLNADRISPPDIDIDIQDSRRDEVIAYCVEKYGQDRVAHIVTFGTMAARNAIRDVSRVLEVPYADADRLAKMVPPPVQGRHTPLKEHLKDNQDLKAVYKTDSVAREVFDLAIKLEGTIRSHGVHAAGVVIAPDDIVNHTPVEMAQKGVIATQYPMYPIEDLGLLKMDFLGLSNLTIVKNALRIIKKVYKKDIELGKIPLDDKKTFKLLGKGDTTGVFQLESAGMKRYIRSLKPTRFEDIIAMVALYRPGPMQFIDEFIARKQGKKKIEYFHPKLKGSLENTYGILVYQEQVMQIAKDISGFTGPQADTLRKAMGKKITVLMNEMKPLFIDGGVKHSKIDRKQMEELWQQLQDFADYGFNKSHAACYGMIAYWTAYLKAHYPEAFMAALMTSDFNDVDRLAIEIDECRHMGIEVLAPDINQSFIEFAIVPDKHQVRFGMAAIKNVGVGAVEEIERERNANGEFKSIEDFAKRVNPRVVNRKTWESLIKAGAFDKFADRRQLLFNLDTILAYANKTSKEASSGQINLFAGSGIEAAEDSLDLAVTENVNERDVLQWERELLGIYLSRHPLDAVKGYLSKNTFHIEDISKKQSGKPLLVGGLIKIKREITTKNGKHMAFVTLEDATGEIEVIVFPDLYEKSKELWAQDLIVGVKGKVNNKDRQGRYGDEVKIIADEVYEINEDTMKQDLAGNDEMPDPSKDKEDDVVAQLFVHIKQPEDNDKLLQLKRLLNKYPGSAEAILVLGDKDKSALKLPFGVEITPELRQAISSIYSSDCVYIKS